MNYDTQNIRAGCDLSIEWNIGHDVSGKDVELVIKGPRGYRPEFTYLIKGNLIILNLPGTEQKEYGLYSLSLTINKNKTGMCIFDEPNVFKIVPYSSMAGGMSSSRHVVIHAKPIDDNKGTTEHCVYSSSVAKMEVMTNKKYGSLPEHSSDCLYVLVKEEDEKNDS